ncbi:hypothetical protein [Haloarcula amylolytica]|uniref:hypothetical protein n=1 Tax=Haloarcula amylolytica TaxID=396317 RepID=UPI000B32356E|nr:hypothetical protein [Haloarcula amylolytica]
MATEDGAEFDSPLDEVIEISGENSFDESLRTTETRTGTSTTRSKTSDVTSSAS